MIRRIGLMLFLAGIVGIVMGFYSFCIELPSREKPAVVTVSELEKDTPWNRHVAISNAVFSVEDAVLYTETRGGYTTGESYFIPVRDSAVADMRSIPPHVFIKVSKALATQMQGKRMDRDFLIEGMRLTRWDFAGKVKDYIATHFGAEIASHVVVIELGKKPEGVGQAIETLFVGIAALAGGIFVFSAGRH